MCSIRSIYFLLFEINRKDQIFHLKAFEFLIRFYTSRSSVWKDVLQKHDVYKTYEIRRESLNVFWDVVVNSYEDFSWKKSSCL